MKLSNLNPFELKPNSWNSNKVERKAFEKLKQSLTRHGAFKPVLVRELADGTLEIIGGYHRNEAAKELGWETVPVINLGELEDERAKEIGLLDNTRYGEDDQELLDKLLDELTDIEGFNAVMPDEDLIELPEEEDLMEKLDEETVEKEETHKILKFKMEVEKAEEIEAILSKVAYDNDYKYADGYSNFTDALYHILVLEKKNV